MMRIISGSRRGKKLVTLSGENTRPTLERVKQAFFNAIQFDIADKIVLDLFAGSGQLGLEALSRGAKFCYFNDMSSDATSVIKKNIDLCKFTQLSQLTCKSYIDCVKMFSRSSVRPSLVFLDPPYGQNLVNDALSLMADQNVLADNSIIVCESAKDDVIDYNGYELCKEYLYSDIKITILKTKNNA